MTFPTNRQPSADQHNPWLDKQLSVSGGFVVLERSEDEKAASAALQWEDVYDRRWKRRSVQIAFVIVSAGVGLVIGMMIGWFVLG